MNPVQLILCIHNHQPVGNFDHVFEHNYQRSYLPFLNVYEKFSDLPLSLHYSGSLWDWLLEHHPEFIDRLKKLLQKGTVELLAGAYYEPILSMIPEPDRQGQIRMMLDFLRRTFDVTASGFWLSERVWEQENTSSLAEAGIQYTIVDDSHFKSAGIYGDKLLGYYQTEDQGRIINIFGTNERLRYTIPYNEPEDIIQYIAETASRNPGALLVYGDDGEKFGGWPGTYHRVYREKWLERFFRLLQENRTWIELLTPKKALVQLKPSGKIYLPDSSYREMMEWALPEDAGVQYERVVNVLKKQIIWNEASVFIRGGFWRNFKHKYPEANQMYARMMEVSKKLRKALSREEPKQSGSQIKGMLLREAETFLYKAQCNCPYWHGVFGGLYLNHLRFETYRNLIRADKKINEFHRSKMPPLSAHSKNNRAKNIGNSGQIEQPHEPPLLNEESDFDFDGRKELALQNRWHRLYIQPHTGGRIYEWDYYPAYTNLLDTLSRRQETYHDAIREPSPEDEKAAAVNNGNDDVGSIHLESKRGEKHLKDYLIYDPYERKSFVDHFISGEITAAKLRRNECSEISGLPLSEYKAHLTKQRDFLYLSLKHSGIIEIDGASLPFEINKTLEVKRTSPAVTCSYTITNTGSTDINTKFGMEWNFALLAGNADDRYYFYENFAHAGALICELEQDQVTHFGLIDEWQQIKITFDYTEPVTLYTFPIETISQSESAYEKVYQSSVIFPVIPVRLPPHEKKYISFIVTVEKG